MHVRACVFVWRCTLRACSRGVFVWRCTLREIVHALISLRQLIEESLQESHNAACACALVSFSNVLVHGCLCVRLKYTMLCFSSLSYFLYE